jgi:hypothetical protein
VNDLKLNYRKIALAILILTIGTMGFSGLFLGVCHYFMTGNEAIYGTEYWLAAAGVGMVGFSCFAGWILLLEAVYIRIKVRL